MLPARPIAHARACAGSSALAGPPRAVAASSSAARAHARLAAPPPPPAKRRRRAPPSPLVAQPPAPGSPAAAASAARRDGAEPGVLAGLTVAPYRGLERRSGDADSDLADRSPSADDAADDDARRPPPPPDLPFHLWHTDAALMAGCEPCVGPHAARAPQQPAPRRLRVAVLLSGGVDSSVALRLAQAAGHEVEAFYLQIWFEEDFRNTWDACPWEEDLAYARAVAEGPPQERQGRLGAGGGGGAPAGAGPPPPPPDPLHPPPVPLTVVPLTRDYWRRVVRESVAEMRRGRTPNPDVLCNSRVKFGAFCAFLERERPGAFDRVASGHYARLLRAGEAGGREAGGAADGQGEAGHEAARAEQAGGDAPAASAAAAAAAAAAASASRWAALAGAAPGEAVLALTPDAVKDQTYFLAALSRAQVERAMFPIAALPKARVRALARSARLPTSVRPDSQGICFLGKVRFPEFVREHLGAWPGPLVAVVDDEDEGEEGDGGERADGEGRRRRRRRRRRSGRSPSRPRGRRATVVGAHEGFWFYTVGQRAGIRLPGGPWYVSRKDPRLNVVEVSRSRPGGSGGDERGQEQEEEEQEQEEEEEEEEERREGGGAAALSSTSSFFCGPVNWLSGARPVFGESSAEAVPPLLVKVRHGPNTHAVAAFEVVVGGGGGAATGAAGAADDGRQGQQQQQQQHQLSSVERALAEAEMAALAAADEAAEAADERQQQQASAAASASAKPPPARLAAAADGEPPPPQQQFARVRLAGRDQGLAEGQYAVFYQGGVCLGSAKMLAAR